MPVTLVTGSSTGIGRATALELARRGHQVWATLRDPARGEELREQVAAESLPIHLATLDVTRDDSVRQAVAEVLAGSGRIDNLVANAGFHAGCAFEDTPFEVFRELVETNYLGLVRCVQAVLPGMRKRGSGCIVGVTSQSGRVVHPTNAAYSGSKFAAEGALEALAIEMGRFGVRVRIVEPGLTFTAAQEKAEPWPTDTPYQPVYRRAGAIFAHDAKQGSSAELVARSVADAVESVTPRLRWVAGVDAERNIAGRARISDEDWVRLHARTDDEAFFSGWRKCFGAGPDALRNGPEAAERAGPEEEST